jgi:glycosyltransferase involved in cell wall biosynthesis
MFELFLKTWRCKQPVIGWILLGDETLGSSRIHGINIHNFLMANSVRSAVVQTNAWKTPNITASRWRQFKLLFSGINILIFQKVISQEAINLTKIVKKVGIKTILVQCDKVDTEMIRAVDQVVVTSDFLKEYYFDTCKVRSVVIDDALEIDTSLLKKHEEKSFPEVVWVGHQDNWRTLELISGILRETHFPFKTISNHPDASVRWDLGTVYKEILGADIAVIPSFADEWSLAKSSNRLTMFMGLGMPVIAAPVPVYKKIIVNGVNGFIAENSSDWIKYLHLLKDVELRKRIGTEARNCVIGQYGVDVIGKKWISLFRSLLTPMHG